MVAAETQGRVCEAWTKEQQRGWKEVEGSKCIKDRQDEVGDCWIRGLREGEELRMMGRCWVGQIVGLPRSLASQFPDQPSQQTAWHIASIQQVTC